MTTSNLEVVQPTVKDGVEFYVSNDGKQSGVSISGLARLCGVETRGIAQNVINPLMGEGTKQPIKQLESLRGKALCLELKGSNGAKIVDFRAASRIIRYYAYESASANETAKAAYDRFADIGLDRWIKDVAGFQEPTKQIDDPSMVSLLTSLHGKFDRLERDVRGYHSVATLYPTVDSLRDAITENSLPSAELYTVTEWAELSHIELTKKQKHELANSVSMSFKTLTGSYAPQVTKYYPNGKARFNKTRAYKIEHFPLIYQCYEKLA